MNYGRSKDLLIEILKAGGVLSVVFIFPGIAPALRPYIKNNKFDKRDFNRTTRRLRENNLIETKENENGVTLYLNKLGKKKALEYSLDKMKITKPMKWDKKWRIVIFDIPENKKLARNVLKRKLDELDFKLLQKSIYVHPFPCENEIEFIRSIYGVRPFVKIIVADSIEEQDRLEKYYHLVQ